MRGEPPQPSTVTGFSHTNRFFVVHVDSFDAHSERLLLIAPPYTQWRRPRTGNRATEEARSGALPAFIARCKRGPGRLIRSPHTERGRHPSSMRPSREGPNERQRHPRARDRRKLNRRHIWSWLTSSKCSATSFSPRICCSSSSSRCWCSVRSGFRRSDGSSAVGCAISSRRSAERRSTTMTRSPASPVWRAVSHPAGRLRTSAEPSGSRWDAAADSGVLC